MAETEGAVQTVAEAYLTLLKARGVDWLFANAGTDFAPIIEALARGATAGLAMPEPLAPPHEGLHDTLLDMTEQRTLLLDNLFGAAG